MTGRGIKRAMLFLSIILFPSMSTALATVEPQVSLIQASPGKSDSTIRISLRLDPGDNVGANADWWLMAETPFGWHHYCLSGSWEPGVAPSYQGPVANLDSFTVPLGSVGAHTIYFCIDTEANGNPDFDKLHCDSVRVGGRGALVSVVPIVSLTEVEVETLLEANGYPPEANHSVDAFKISYLTVDALGAEITASGLLLFPVGLTSPRPLLSAHHGTLAMAEDAPSLRFRSAMGLYDMEGLLFASAGYVTILPDYIGFGDSVESMRPYLHADSYATVTIDMLRAARDFCEKKGLSLSGQLFLHGYSEGGYATLAVQKGIEIGLMHEFRVTASAPMAGPYDLSETIRDSMDRKNRYTLFPIILSLYAYDSIYDLQIRERIFQAKSLAIMNAGLSNPASVEELTAMGYEQVFRPEFLSSYLGDGEVPLKEVVGKNNLGVWKPVAPVRLYHCVDDEVVLFFNSARVHESFLSQGADNVTLEARSYGTHADCYPKTVLEVRQWFDSFKPN